MSHRLTGVALQTVALAVLLPWLLRPCVASAGETPLPSVDGSWNMSAVTETFTVQQWSAPCGPAPVTGTAQPGGVVRLRADGSEFAIEGGRRTLRTDGCLDGMPTLASEAHSTTGRSWRTRCATPPSDPRRAMINTAYFMTSDDTIQIAETGRYELTINNAHCIADVKRDASLTRVFAPAATTSSVPSQGVASRPPTPLVTTSALPGTVAAPPRPDCSAPGDPARLEVRPSRKLLRVGDTFGFRAVVVDGAGCPTGTPIQWSIGALRFKDGQSHAALPTLDGSGRLSAPPDTADATFDVVASAAGKSARASVDVTTAANYEALLAQSGLDRNGERSDPAVAVLATGSIGASDVRAEDGAQRRRTIFIAIVAALTLALGVVAAIGVRRSRKARAVEQAAEARHEERMRDYESKKREREEAHAAQLRAHFESVASAQQAAEAAAARGLDAGPMFCPSCRREFSGGGAFCPYDSNRLVAIAGHRDLMVGPSGGVCPTCRRGFNPGVKICPHDGDELLPAGMITSGDSGARYRTREDLPHVRRPLRWLRRLLWQGRHAARFAQLTGEPLRTSSRGGGRETRAALRSDVCEGRSPDEDHMPVVSGQVHDRRRQRSSVRSSRFAARSAGRRSSSTEVTRPAPRRTARPKHPLHPTMAAREAGRTIPGPSTSPTAISAT